MQVNFTPYERHGLSCGSSPRSLTNFSQGGLSAAGKRLAELLARVWLNFFLLFVICLQPCEVLVVCEPQSRLQTIENTSAFTCEKPCEVQLISEPQSRLQTVENLPPFTCEKPCEVQLVSVLEFRLVSIWFCAKKIKGK